MWWSSWVIRGSWWRCRLISADGGVVVVVWWREFEKTMEVEFSRFYVRRLRRRLWWWWGFSWRSRGFAFLLGSSWFWCGSLVMLGVARLRGIGKLLSELGSIRPDVFLTVVA